MSTRVPQPGLTCSSCKLDVPMPDLMCDCPEPVCSDCHNLLRHPGSSCPDCTGSHGFITIGRHPNGQSITTACPTCGGTGRLS